MNSLATRTPNAAPFSVSSGVGGAPLRRLPAQIEVAVKGVHFVQEDSPDEIGQAVAGWMKTLD
jgi:hypothetical protein